MKIFLGGTCSKGFDYRTILIPLLEENSIDYFNPVVDDWTPDCIAEEEHQKEVCDIHLYVITSNMKGVYSIAETFASHIQGKRSIFVVIEEGFDEAQLKSLNATANLFAECGGESWVLTDNSDINSEFVADIVRNVKWKF